MSSSWNYSFYATPLFRVEGQGDVLLFIAESCTMPALVKVTPDETIPFKMELGSVMPGFQVLPHLIRLLSMELNNVWEHDGCMERSVSTVVSGVTKQVSWRLMREASCKILDFHILGHRYLWSLYPIQAASADDCMSYEVAKKGSAPVWWWLWMCCWINKLYERRLVIRRHLKCQSSMG